MAEDAWDRFPLGFSFLFCWCPTWFLVLIFGACGCCPFVGCCPLARLWLVARLWRVAQLWLVARLSLARLWLVVRCWLENPWLETLVTR